MPAPINLELKNLRETQKATVQLIKDLQGPEMVRAMAKATLLIQGTARKEAKENLGHWRASITPSVSMSGDVVEGIVGSNLEHGIYADLDCRPHWPPIRPIQEWVHQKRLAGTYRISYRNGGRVVTQQRTGNALTQYWEDRWVAFLVARKIASRGTRGDHALEKGLEQNITAIENLIGQAVATLTARWGIL